MRLGAWTVADFGSKFAPAYRMLVPNMLRSYPHPQNITVHMASRAMKVSRYLLPVERATPTIEIIAARMGMSG